MKQCGKEEASTGGQENKAGGGLEKGHAGHQAVK